MRGFIGIIGLGLFLLLSSSCSQSDNFTVGSFPREVARVFGTDAARHPAVSISKLFLTSRTSTSKDTTPDDSRMHAWKKYNTDPSELESGTPRKLALCRAAMDRASGRWDMRPAYKDRVMNAKNAGLTEDKCLNILAEL